MLYQQEPKEHFLNNRAVPCEYKNVIGLPMKKIFAVPALLYLHYSPSAVKLHGLFAKLLFKPSVNGGNGNKLDSCINNTGSKQYFTFA